MTDIVSALVKKKARFAEAKRKIQEEAKRQCDELDVEIAKVDQALDTINSTLAPYICPACHGTGEESFTDAAGSRDTRSCTKCGGSGIVNF